MGPEMLLLVGAGGGGEGAGRSGCSGKGQGSEGREEGGGEWERGNAPNHDNFSSPQLHC